MRSPKRLAVPGALVATCTILLSLATAGLASADTKVRFLHAVPGAPAAKLTVKGGSGPAATLPDIGFANASEFATGPSGAVSVALTAGGKQVGMGKETLPDGGSYTIVAEKGQGSAITFRVYRSGKATPGKALVRAVHAAPEAGKVDMTLGGRKWGTVAYGQDTGYKPAEPGSYDLKAQKAGMGSALMEQKGVNASAGTADTAYAVGTSGQASRFVVVQDSVAAPSGAPATGLGGMAGSDGPPWVAALLAALAAGALGGLVYTRVPLGRGRAGR
jgi:hypothetical protein